MPSPSNYIANLPRVSTIVEWVFPFSGEDKARFISWLYNHGIKEGDYMKEASTGGTFVHKKLEDFINKGSIYKGNRYKNYIGAGMKFLSEVPNKIIGTEVYIKTKDYQGTVDLIGEIDGKKYILDWKTYGLAKDKFNLQSEYKKPYSKLKKAQLQLSLYARALRINNIGVIELSNDGNYHFHVLEKINNDDLKDLIYQFNNNYIDEL